MESPPPRGPRPYAPPRRAGPPEAPRGAEARGPPRGPPAASERRRMLDLSREGHFKYDLKEILARSSLPAEQIAGFAATLFSKGSRLSTLEAKDWVTGKLHENVLTKTERDAINTLLDRYSKWR